MSNDQSNNDDRHFFMTIVPTNTSGQGDPDCHLVVIEHIIVIDEPIFANGANDMNAIEAAHESVALRLGVDIENVQY
jgi:hypothetical protein